MFSFTIVHPKQTNEKGNNRIKREKLWTWLFSKEMHKEEIPALYTVCPRNIETCFYVLHFRDI